MDLTTITHDGATGRDGFTVTTGQDTTLAEDVSRDEALRALFHRGFTPSDAVAAVNAAVRIGRFSVKALPAD